MKIMRWALILLIVFMIIGLYMNVVALLVEPCTPERIDAIVLTIGVALMCGSVISLIDLA